MSGKSVFIRTYKPPSDMENIISVAVKAVRDSCLNRALFATNLDAVGEFGPEVGC
jgi:predicted transcriptional regulator